MSERRSSSSSDGPNRRRPCRGGCVWMTSMSKPGCPPGHRLCDTAEADQSERRAVHVPGQVRAETPSVQRPSRRSRSASDARRSRREDQEEGEVCRGVIEHAWGVAHRHAQAGWRRHVDVVVADRRVGHHPERPGPSGARARSRRSGRSDGRRCRRTAARASPARPRVERRLSRRARSRGRHREGVGPALGQRAGDEERAPPSGWCSRWPRHP